MSLLPENNLSFGMTSDLAVLCKKLRRFKPELHGANTTRNYITVCRHDLPVLSETILLNGGLQGNTNSADSFPDLEQHPGFLDEYCINGLGVRETIFKFSAVAKQKRRA